MADTSKKLFVVLGASGIQGSSVIRAVLANPTLSSQYNIVGVSRDPAAARQKQPLPDSVTYTRADLNDPASLIAAFQGAYAVFGTTNFWELFSPAAEIQQGKQLADACKAAGVKHLIWAAQVSAEKVSGGKYKEAGHLDSKYAVSQYIEQIKGDDMVATHLCVPFYLSNIPRLFVFPGADGVREWRYPWHAEKTRVGFVDAKPDVGLFAAGILSQDPQSMNGKYIHAVTAFLTPAEIAATFKEVKGEELRYSQIGDEEFKAMLPPALQGEIPLQMAMVREFGLYGPNELEEQKEHDKVLEGLGAGKSSLKAYLEREWDEDAKPENSMMRLFS